MSDRIERELTVPAAVEDVWPAVSDPRELSEWFGADVELDARPGGRGVFRWPDGTERGAVVEELDAPRRFTFRWLPFERDADGRVREVPPTRVELELEECADGTRIRVVETPAFEFTDARACEWTVSRASATWPRPLARIG